MVDQDPPEINIYKKSFQPMNSNVNTLKLQLIMDLAFKHNKLEFQSFGKIEFQYENAFITVLWTQLKNE